MCSICDLSYQVNSIQSSMSVTTLSLDQTQQQHVFWGYLYTVCDGLKE